MTILDRSRARQIIEGFAGRRIAVVGDLMLDRFIWGSVRRISPEAPVPVVEVDRESQHLGGAGNVVANVVALGAQAWPFGVVGDDANADLLELELRRAGIDVSGIVRDGSRPTTTKTRIVAHNQQVVRADRERRHEISSEVEDAVARAFAARLDEADAVVVSDYDKGLLAGGLLARVLERAAVRGVSVCLDPKVQRFARYRPVTIITPNHHEAEAATGMPAATDSEIEACARRIQEMLGGPAVLVTRGEAGMTLVDAAGEVAHVPTTAREVYDVTGAGDTVIATLALALATGATTGEGAALANFAAGVVVGKIGTATATGEELAAAIRRNTEGRDSL
jgi:D-beta-D-heptose 7-phosphate kinase/D-beta-D-heptose 1-phosphate adenosyltransferase